jgi:hypothetical protein
MEIQKKSFDCQCGKKFAHAPSLCIHRKKCSIYQEHKIANPKPNSKPISDPDSDPNHNPNLNPNPNPNPNIKLVIQEKDDVSVLSTTTTDSSVMRILELENELKLTELKNKYELRLKDIEMENILKLKNLELENQELKFSLKLKNLEIEMLNKIVQQPVQLPVQVQQPVQVPVYVQEPVQVQVQQVQVQSQVQEPVVESVKITKPSTLDFLNSNLEDAYTIEDCFDMLKIPEHNEYLFEEMFTLEGQVKFIINPKFSLKKQYNCWTSNAVNIIASLFIKFKKEELPFYVCRKNKNSCLYIKTNNGWIKASEKDAEDLLLKFCNKAVSSVGLAITNTCDIFKKSPRQYGKIFEINKDNITACNFDEWHSNHKAEILNTLFVFKENSDVGIKKLKSLLIKMDPNNPDTED